MANILTGQVLQIDTAAVIYGPGGALGANAITLGRIFWSGMGNADVLQIEDENGAIIFKATASLANDWFYFNFKGMLAGFEVATIDGGLLLYYPYI